MDQSSEEWSRSAIQSRKGVQGPGVSLNALNQRTATNFIETFFGDNILPIDVCWLILQTWSPVDPYVKYKTLFRVKKTSTWTLKNHLHKSLFEKLLRVLSELSSGCGSNGMGKEVIGGKWHLKESPPLVGRYLTSVSFQIHRSTLIGEVSHYTSPQSTCRKVRPHFIDVDPVS